MPLGSKPVYLASYETGDVAISLTTDVDAPAYTDLASTPRVTALSLRAFLETPHERMPDLHLDRDETDNVIAYILSLER